MNKIKLIQIIGFLLISNNIFSQDLIFLKNGEEIKSKVIEIDTLKIKGIIYILPQRYKKPF